MSEEIVLNADNRVRTGTNKNREIRRNESMVPAVIYGNNQDTKNIKLYLNEITKASESELFFMSFNITLVAYTLSAGISKKP